MLHANRNIARDTNHQCPYPASTGQIVGQLERARYVVFCTLVVLLALCTTLGTPVSAQSRPPKSTSAPAAPYEELLDQAVSAFEASDFRRAHKLFEQAYAIRPNARVSRGLGIAALRLERYTEAQHWLSSALEDENQALTPTQRDEVTKLMSWMQTSLGVLQLRWSAPPPHANEILLDDERVQELSLWLTPGAHRLRVRAPGFEARDEQVEIVAGRERKRELSLTPSAPVHQSAPQLVTLHREDMLGPEDAAHTAAHSGALDLRPSAAASGPRDQPSIWSRWWFWTAAGVLVAGGVTAAVILTAKPAERPYEAGGEGGVLHARGVLP